LLDHRNSKLPAPLTMLRRPWRLPWLGTTRLARWAGRSIGRPVAAGLTLFIVILVAATVGRQIVDSLLARLDFAKDVHRDATRFAQGLAPEVRPTLRLIYRNRDGETVRALVDEADYAAFVAQSFALLEARKTETAGRIPEQVARQLAPLERDAQARVAAYADWYFAWPTGYAILGEAVKSAATHLPAVELAAAKDMVAKDVGDYIARHYEQIVLYPEATDAEVSRSFAAAYQEAHDGYLAALAELDGRFQEFVERSTSHTQPLPAGALAQGVDIDWSSQVRKLRLAAHERGNVIEVARLGGLASLGLVGSKLGGALAGRSVSLGERVAAPAAERLAAKAAAPLVEDGLAVGGGAVGGGTIGGPLGALVGVALGLGADYVINKGVEWANRDAFEKDARDAVQATYAELADKMAGQIAQNADVWFEDTIQLLATYPGRP
jgi:hypothetical protein